MFPQLPQACRMMRPTGLPLEHPPRSMKIRNDLIAISLVRRWRFEGPGTVDAILRRIQSPFAWALRFFSPFFVVSTTEGISRISTDALVLLLRSSQPAQVGSFPTSDYHWRVKPKYE
jgi:hypothetical protein